MTHYRRERPRRAGAGAQRRCARRRQLPWFARNVVIKVLIIAQLGRLTSLFGHDPAFWPY